MTVQSELAIPVALRRARHREARTTDELRLRRVQWIWLLLFWNVLSYVPHASILPLPHKVGQLITQCALVLAMVLALSVNPRVRVRPNAFLALYSLLAITSLAMSVRFIGFGGVYRAFRLIGFLGVLWLLTPWFGRRDLFLVRTHIRVLLLVLVSVALGLVISPHKALALNFGTHRLDGALWPIFTTQLAHYMAELVGLVAIFWMCGLFRRRQALLIIVPGLVALLATHTRTALGGLAIGLLVAGLSLFMSQRRVRRTMATVTMVAIIALIPLYGFVTSWLLRGETTTQVQDLSGRTKVWPAVLSESKPETNKILGSGLSNGSVVGATDPTSNGLPIDGGWIASYQDQGIVGWVLEGSMFLVLLLTALLRPRGPTRAMALFLITYCLIASFTESGLGEASTYLMDLTLAAALLMPAWEGARRASPSARRAPLRVGLRGSPWPKGGSPPPDSHFIS